MTIETFRCPHGFGPEYRGYTGLMAAPWARCKCCGTTYYYIDSFSWSRDEQGITTVTGRAHTPNLCDDCGGKYEHQPPIPSDTAQKEAAG